MPKATQLTARCFKSPTARLSQAQEQTELERYVAHLKKHPKEAKGLLVNAGIYTKSGKLTKAFGG